MAGTAPYKLHSVNVHLLIPRSLYHVVLSPPCTPSATAAVTSVAVTVEPNRFTLGDVGFDPQQKHASETGASSAGLSLYVSSSFRFVVFLPKLCSIDTSHSFAASVSCPLRVQYRTTTGQPWQVAPSLL